MSPFTSEVLSLFWGGVGGGGARYKYVNACLPPIHNKGRGAPSICAVEGWWGRGRGGSGDKKEAGRGAYTLLTTTSSHGSSFSGTYYSAAALMNNKRRERRERKKRKKGT